MAKVAVRRSTTPAPSLLANLVAYWPLSEASGQRNDLHTNALHLSEVGTLGADTGLVYANAADFDMTADNALTRLYANVAAINWGPGDAFTIVVWCYPTALTGGPDSPDYYRYLYSLNGGSYNGGGYRMQTTSAGQIYIEMGNTGGDPGDTISWHVPDVALSLNSWQMVTFSYDGPTGAAACSRNAGTASTTTNTHPFTAATSGNFMVGCSATPAYVWDGRIGPLTMFDKVLSASEITWLYNSGAGRTYAVLE
jgi:hypothetical protein